MVWDPVQAIGFLFRIDSENVELTRIPIYKYFADNLPVFSEANLIVSATNPAPRDGRIYFVARGSESAFPL